MQMRAANQNNENVIKEEIVSFEDKKNVKKPRRNR